MPSTRSATRPWFFEVSAPMTAHCSAVDSSMRVKRRGHGHHSPVCQASAAEHVAGGERAVVEHAAVPAREPPRVSVATTSTAASSSRSSGGGGKYSSSVGDRDLLDAVARREAGDHRVDELLGRRRAGGHADDAGRGRSAPRRAC